jgi:hypothetical protein
VSLEHSPTRSRKKASLKKTSLTVFPNEDNRVLSVRQWAELNGFSLSTARRILCGPESERPVITQLSVHRYGITIGNNRRWQESRAK